MAKGEKVRNKLTAEEYWEWRTTIAELQLAEEKLKTATQEIKLVEKDIGNLQLSAKLLIATNHRRAKDNQNEAKDEYEKFKKLIEERTGTSLNNKIIDDVNFEIKDLPKQENSDHTKV